MSGEADLLGMIDKLSAMTALNDELPGEVATALKLELEGQIARGEGPDGTPWEKTKDGKVPLQNAAKALTVTASGRAVIAELKGPEALHHLGAAKGKIKRQILPTRAMPDKFVAALKTAVATKIGDSLG